MSNWVVPIIKSKDTRVFQNAIWLVHRHTGDPAAPTLIRCPDMEDPSVASYDNCTPLWPIGACGGPNLKYNGKGTAQQVEENRKVLAQLQQWHREHSAKPRRLRKTGTARRGGNVPLGTAPLCATEPVPMFREPGDGEVMARRAIGLSSFSFSFSRRVTLGDIDCVYC